METTEPVASADDVAAAIIRARPGLDQMQLHKLLYLVQAACLAWFDMPAFENEIQAWKYGPVVRMVAGHYQHFGDSPIMESLHGDPNQLDDRRRWVVDKIVEQYGATDGFTLAAKFKGAGSPWREARKGLADDAPSQVRIGVEAIREYHRRLGLLPAPPSEREARMIDRFFDGDHEALADLFESVTGVRPTE